MTSKKWKKIELLNLTQMLFFFKVLEKCKFNLVQAIDFRSDF